MRDSRDDDDYWEQAAHSYQETIKNLESFLFAVCGNLVKAGLQCQVKDVPGLEKWYTDRCDYLRRTALGKLSADEKAILGIK